MLGPRFPVRPRTGEPLQLPAYDPCRHSRSKIHGDEVYVDFTILLNGAEAPNFSVTARACYQNLNKLPDQDRTAGHRHGADENKTNVYS